MLVIAIIAILAALLLPVLQQAQARSRRVQCLSQLKQIGLALHMFAHDHDGKFPWIVSTNAGGSMWAGFPGDLQVLSNELVSPKLVVCPADRGREPAASFSELLAKNISYALIYRLFGGYNCDLSDTTAQDEPLVLDRNLVRTDGRWNWSGSTVHNGSGNILFVGGHVESVSTANLDGALRNPWVLSAVRIPEDAVVTRRGGPGSGSAGSSGSRSGTGAGGSSGFSALQSFFEANGTSSGGGPTPGSAGNRSSTATSSETTLPRADETGSLRPTPTNAPAVTSRPSRSTNSVPAALERPDGPLVVPSVSTVVPPVQRSFNWLLLALLILTASVLCGVVLERRRRQRRLLGADKAD
jgi:prepilin-type processing-associated H-X9-DG protein